MRRCAGTSGDVREAAERVGGMEALGPPPFAAPEAHSNDAQAVETAFKIARELNVPLDEAFHYPDSKGDTMKAIVQPTFGPRVSHRVA